MVTTLIILFGFIAIIFAIICLTSPFHSSKSENAIKRFVISTILLMVCLIFASLLILLL